MKYSLKFCLSLTVLAIAISKVKCWSYDEQSLWYIDYPDCGGKRQSPVKLKKSDAIKPATAISPLKFINYDKNFPLVNITNNGHTANIIIPKPSKYSWPKGDMLLPLISGGKLPIGASFIVESIHFHWGAKDDIGSEHPIDNNFNAMEMHIVHRNTKYPSVESALLHADGLAVLAVMFSVNKVSQPVAGMNQIVNALPAIQFYKAVTNISNFVVYKLIDSVNVKNFYSYEGSLTTPSCAEAVQWTVFSQAVEISKKQINKFRQLFNERKKLLVNNYRRTQAINGRKIYLRV